MKIRILLLIILFCVSCVKSQEKNPDPKLVGGPCEGCEAIYEYGREVLNSVDTIPGFSMAKEQLKITGIIYKSDGKTPAKDVILYAYQTNEKGIYPKRSTSKGWEKRHGYMRGWIKTDSNGQYTLYTFRPASYPNTTIEQHIHLTVKEPIKNEYYIANINFDDDPNLSIKIRNNKFPRGGNGIVKLSKKGKFLVASRDIILGRYIPNYN